MCGTMGLMCMTPVGPWSAPRGAPPRVGRPALPYTIGALSTACHRPLAHVVPILWLVVVLTQANRLKARRAIYLNARLFPPVRAARRRRPPSAIGTSTANSLLHTSPPPPELPNRSAWPCSTFMCHLLFYQRRPLHRSRAPTAAEPLHRRAPLLASPQPQLRPPADPRWAPSRAPPLSWSSPLPASPDSGQPHRQSPPRATL
jgi:hypothetical protein